MAEWLLEIYLFPTKKKPPCSLTAYIHNYLGRYLLTYDDVVSRSLVKRKGGAGGKAREGHAGTVLSKMMRLVGWWVGSRMLSRSRHVM